MAVLARVTSLILNPSGVWSSHCGFRKPGGGNSCLAMSEQTGASVPGSWGHHLPATGLLPSQPQASLIPPPGHDAK